jgi:hypothetical protein
MWFTGRPFPLRFSPRKGRSRMTVPDAAASEGCKRKAVPSSKLPGAYSSQLPRKAKIIRATTDPNDPAHPSSVHAKAVEDFVKADKRSKRRARHAESLRAKAIARNPRAAYVTTTFVQHSGDPRTELRAAARKKKSVGPRRTCKSCGNRKGIAAFPPGLRAGTISTVCGKCLKRAAS